MFHPVLLVGHERVLSGGESIRPSRFVGEPGIFGAIPRSLVFVTRLHFAALLGRIQIVGGDRLRVRFSQHRGANPFRREFLFAIELRFLLLFARRRIVLNFFINFFIFSDAGLRFARCRRRIPGAQGVGGARRRAERRRIWFACRISLGRGRDSPDASSGRGARWVGRSVGRGLRRRRFLFDAGVHRGGRGDGTHPFPAVG